MSNFAGRAIKYNPCIKLHFVGVLGSGMAPLAAFHALGGGKVSGSDRLLGSPAAERTREALRGAGVALFPQDGSGVDASVGRLIVSTAVEAGNADLRRAAELDVPVVHRADALAELANARRSIAVAGTSGKSTVTAMVFEILAAAGKDPSLITGAPLVRLMGDGALGSAFRGGSDLMVLEADESDGTIEKYRPALGVVLNLGRDHKEPKEVLALFRGFRERSGRCLVNADDPALSGLARGAATFGFQAGGLLGKDPWTDGRTSRFSAEGVAFELPLPGLHNAANGLAAAAACREEGVSLEESAAALRGFQGVWRRFQHVGTARGVDVIDDYAHNPDKVRAAVAAARARGSRVLAVFQPHGFGPMRFLKDDLIEAFSSALGEGDVLWVPDIYYAGGTAVKDITSADLAGPIRMRGRDARHVPDRGEIASEIARTARQGDVVLVMGARDPSLGGYARSVLDALKGEQLP